MGSSEREEKAFKLSEKLCGLEGVTGCEVYAKSLEKTTYDVLIKTENGQLIEGTVSGPVDLELMLRYLDVVLEMDKRNFRNYPNLEKEIEQN